MFYDHGPAFWTPVPGSCHFGHSDFSEKRESLDGGLVVRGPLHSNKLNNVEGFIFESNKTFKIFNLSFEF